MKYLLAIYVNEAGWAEYTPEEQAEGMKVWEALNQEMTDAGVYLAGEGLAPTATATSLRIPESGDALISDGPFAETKEALGGFYLLDCADLDEAISWARKIPYSGGGVEVRPVMQFEGSGEADSQEAVEARQ